MGEFVWFVAFRSFGRIAWKSSRRVAAILDDISRKVSPLALSIRLIGSTRRHLAFSDAEDSYVSLGKEGKSRRKINMVTLYKLYFISRGSLKFGSMLKSEMKSV